MISFSRYATLLREPELRSAIAASVLGRLPLGITGLAVLLLAQSSTGSFAVGGGTAACYTAGLGAIAPALGRLIDRFGPRAPMLACAFAFPTALAALVAALTRGTSLGAAYLCAAAAGASFPPITICMRTFLRQRLKDDSLLAAAYSLESVVIETIFIAGPMLVALFVALASPAAAVLFAAACGCAGPLLFIRSRAIAAWRIEPRRASSLFGPLADPTFPPLLVVVVCYAGAFGLVEIGTTAFAAERGAAAFAGVLLGIMSVGSVVGGLVYGSRSWRPPLARQYSVTLALMGLGIAPLALPAPLAAFALWCLPAGLVMAPALIMQSMLVATTAPPEYSAEAFTWSATSLLAGISLGLSGGGMLLAGARSPTVFVVAALLALAAAALAATLLRAPRQR
ncbi:MAG TPA: MFS transporter [Burkholderiales bacterium]|nr:MFS transporter [Burkholderiales bacterium]